MINRNNAAIFTGEQIQSIANAMKKGATAYLAKDQGLYICIFHEEGKPSPLVEYALGMNPNRDTGWHERCRDVAGGDDFAQQLDEQLVRDLAEQSQVHHRIIIQFEPDSISFGIAEPQSNDQLH